MKEAIKMTLLQDAKHLGKAKDEFEVATSDQADYFEARGIAIRSENAEPSTLPLSSESSDGLDGRSQPALMSSTDFGHMANSEAEIEAPDELPAVFVANETMVESEGEGQSVASVERNSSEVDPSSASQEEETVIPDKHNSTTKSKAKKS